MEVAEPVKTFAALLSPVDLNSTPKTHMVDRVSCKFSFDFHMTPLATHRKT